MKIQSQLLLTGSYGLIPKSVMLFCMIGCLLACGDNPESKQTQSSSTSPETAPVYLCPMHTSYTSNKPGSCPICGMSLVKQGAVDAVQGSSPVSGYSVVHLVDLKQRMLGLETTTIQEQQLTSVIYAVGRIELDETRVHHVHTKFGGVIEQLFVGVTGQAVNAGEPLFTIFSPELVSTQNEYILARDSNQSALVKATRSRLQLWDIGEGEISQLERERVPTKTLAIRSPVSGVVLSKNVFHGMRVGPEETIYDIADLSSVWVNLDIYEQHLPQLQVGDKVSLALPSTAKTWDAKIEIIQPLLNEKTRTVQARVTLPNLDAELRPGMLLESKILVESRVGLFVPADSVVTTGHRNIVFVGGDKDHFIPREIQLGAAVEGGYQVLSGLTAGERIVSRGNFLLDAESRLRAPAISGSGEASQPLKEDHSHHNRGL